MSGEDLPRARVRRCSRPWLHAVWIIPLAAALLAGWLIYDRLREYGPEVVIEFRDGGGVRAGQTPIKYRGVQVGQVTRVEISGDHDHVRVSARLDRSAASLASEGALFWIVRPEVGWGSVSGLSTVISGPEIQVIAGKGAPARDFKGLEHAPVALGEPGLKIVLKAERPVSLRANSPVYYRGVQVGVVQQVTLSPNATSADLHLLVWERYAPLVRTGSAFWNASGISLKGGIFKGLKLDIDSLRAIVAGGIEFASPGGSPRAKPGATFFLNASPRREWLAWSPKIPIGKEGD